MQQPSGVTASRITFDKEAAMTNQDKMRAAFDAWLRNA